MSGWWYWGWGLYKKVEHWSLLWALAEGWPRVVGSMSERPCHAVTISGFFWSAKFFQTLNAPSSGVWRGGKRGETGEKRGVVNAQRTGGRSFTSQQWKTATVRWFEEKTKNRSVFLGERKSKFGKDGKNKKKSHLWNSQRFTHLSYTCKAVSVTLNMLCINSWDLSAFQEIVLKNEALI